MSVTKKIPISSIEIHYGNVYIRDGCNMNQISCVDERISELIHYFRPIRFETFLEHFSRDSLFESPFFADLLRQGYLLSSTTADHPVTEFKFILDLDHPVYGPNFIRECRLLVEHFQHEYENAIQQIRQKDLEMKTIQTAALVWTPEQFRDKTQRIQDCSMMIRAFKEIKDGSERMVECLTEFLQDKN